MKEHDFEIFLSSDPSVSSSKAAATRKRHAKIAEGILGTSLDVIVGNDDIMYEALEQLQQLDDPDHSRMQNALRKYYKFCNGKEFPYMKDYHSPKHP